VPGAPNTAPQEAAARAEVVHPVELPSAIPAILEACKKLAGEAAARGEHVLARELIELAGRVASANYQGR
jgi:hypothetical protein